MKVSSSAEPENVSTDWPAYKTPHGKKIQTAPKGKLGKPQCCSRVTGPEAITRGSWCPLGRTSLLSAAEDGRPIALYNAATKRGFARKKDDRRARHLCSSHLLASRPRKSSTDTIRPSCAGSAARCSGNDKWGEVNRSLEGLRVFVSREAARQKQ